MTTGRRGVPAWNLLLLGNGNVSWIIQDDKVLGWVEKKTQGSGFAGASPFVNYLRVDIQGRHGEPSFGRRKGKRRERFERGRLGGGGWKKEQREVSLLDEEGARVCLLFCFAQRVERK